MMKKGLYNWKKKINTTIMSWCCKCCKKSGLSHQSTLKLLNKRYSLIPFGKTEEESVNEAFTDFCVPGTTISRIQPKTSDSHQPDMLRTTSLTLENPRNSLILRRRSSNIDDLNSSALSRDSKVQLGKIQPNLYSTEENDQESENKLILIAPSSLSPALSPTSVPFSPTNEEIADETYGNVTFSIIYEENLQRLLVHIKEIEGLPCKGMDQKYDPFITLSILPGDRLTKSSLAVKQTLSPRFNEDFTFPMERKELTKKTLRISVYDFERQNQQDAIGHVLLPLQEVKKSPEKMNLELKLRPQGEIHSELGELILSLCYIPSQDKLCSVVLRAKNLQTDRNISGIYVKATLTCGGEKVKSRKTLLVESNLNPSFNQTFSFIVPPSYLDEANLIFTVNARNFLKTDHILGRVLIGPYIYSQGEKLTHWGEMLKSRQSVVKRHRLYL